MGVEWGSDNDLVIAISIQIAAGETGAKILAHLTAYEKKEKRSSRYVDLIRRGISVGVSFRGKNMWLFLILIFSSENDISSPNFCPLSFSSRNFRPQNSLSLNISSSVFLSTDLFQRSD